MGDPQPIDLNVMAFHSTVDLDHPLFAVCFAVFIPMLRFVKFGPILLQYSPECGVSTRILVAMWLMSC